MAEMLRVNTRISTDLNSWLDSESDRTGLPKSTLIMLGLEEYRRNREAMKALNDVSPVLTKLDEIMKYVKQS